MNRMGRATLALMGALLAVGCGDGMELLRSGTAPLAIKVLERAPVDAGEGRELASGLFASDTWSLYDGLGVLFSASYGTEGEAGQARGRLVERDGGFHYVQEANPTGQLLLAPGQVFSAGDESLWEFGSYFALIAGVAGASLRSEGGELALYGAAAMSRVRFEGGTAQRTVRYDDAVEIVLGSTSPSGVKTDVRMYFVQGLGPVALEFREGGAVGGTFKLYMDHGP